MLGNSSAPRSKSTALVSTVETERCQRLGHMEAEAVGHHEDLRASRSQPLDQRAERGIERNLASSSSQRGFLPREHRPFSAERLAAADGSRRVLLVNRAPVVSGKTLEQVHTGVGHGDGAVEVKKDGGRRQVHWLKQFCLSTEESAVDNARRLGERRPSGGGDVQGGVRATGEDSRGSCRGGGRIAAVRPVGFACRRPSLTVPPRATPSVRSRGRSPRSTSTATACSTSCRPTSGTAASRCSGAWAAATFGPATSIAAGPSPTTVSVGDLNHDNDPDLAVTTSPTAPATPAVVGAPRRERRCRSRPPVAHQLAQNALGGTMADVDGDGHLDVIAVDPFGMSVLIGAGDGSLGAAVRQPVGTFLASVSVGDFNGDNDPDLALGQFVGQALVLLGGPGASFGPPTGLTAGFAPDSPAVGDVNGDGHLDLAVADLSSPNVSVLLGAGDGTFAAATTYNTGVVNGGDPRGRRPPRWRRAPRHRRDQQLHPQRLGTDQRRRRNVRARRQLMRSAPVRSRLRRGRLQRRRRRATSPSPIRGRLTWRCC